MTVEIDFNHPDLLANPYRAYQQLREQAALCWIPAQTPNDGMWLVTRYADVEQAIKHPRLSSDAGHYHNDPQLLLFDGSIFTKDPPDHTRLRTLVGHGFTPRRIRAIEPRIGAICDRLLDTMQGCDTVDLVADYAAQLPLTIIADMLGVEPDDCDQLRGWANTIIRMADITRANEYQEVLASLNAFRAHLHHLIECRRHQRRHDLISTLLDAQEQHDRLSTAELLAFCELVLIAGYETTTNLISSAILTLKQHPAQLARLVAQPELLPSAIEEVLRYVSPAQQSGLRVAIAPLELGGQRLAAGELVLPVLAAANRDPAQFPRPDRFDITREPNRHLAFGYGLHYCLGAPLARLEAHVAIGKLLDWLPTLQLLDETPNWKPNLRVRGLQSMPAHVERRQPA